MGTVDGHPEGAASRQLGAQVCSLGTRRLGVCAGVWGTEGQLQRGGIGAPGEVSRGPGGRAGRVPSFTAPSLTGPDIVDIKPANMEDLTEVITASEFHPHHCNLFVYSSSKGSLRLCDMRAAALCDKHSKRKCPRLGLTPRSAGGADPKGRRNCQGSAWGGEPLQGCRREGLGGPGPGRDMGPVLRVL